MSSALDVREGKELDLRAVAGLLARSAQDPWTVEMLADTFSSQQAFLFVASAPGVEGEILGMLFGVYLDEEAQVLQVAVAPECRRKGLARQLLGIGHGSLSARGVRSVTLEVRAGNAPAITLYERLGYVRVGVRKAFYRDGEDALALSLDLALAPPGGQ